MDDAEPSGLTRSGSAPLSLIDQYVARLTAPLPAITTPNEPQTILEAPPSGARKGQAFRPPANLIAAEMEMALVAAALQDARVFALDLQPADLYDDRLRAIWKAGQALVQDGRGCDRVLLSDALRHSGAGVSGDFLAHVAAQNASPANAAEYAARVCDLAHRRRVFAELQTADRIVRGTNETWTDDLTRVTARLAKMVLPAQQDRSRAPTGWSAAELLAARFPDPQWAVPGLIPVGLSILAGRPKVGKSWLALQVVIAAGTGGRVLDRVVQKGSALYCALEDNGRRLQERAVKQGMPCQACVRFETTWPRLTDGGLDLLAQAIDAEGYTLVAIDTLGRAVGRVDMDDYGDTTRLLGALQALAISRDMAIVVVDHHRKGIAGAEDDPVDAILGSTGKAGTADAVLGLTRQQGRPGARLRIKGRELEELDLVLTWDPVLCCWQYQRTAEEAKLTGRRGQVLAILQAAYPGALLATQIAEEAQMHRQNLARTLNDLIREGHVTREQKQGRDQPYRAIQGNRGGG